jgi:hypothetical protein
LPRNTQNADKKVAKYYSDQICNRIVTLRETVISDPDGLNSINYMKLRASDHFLRAKLKTQPNLVKRICGRGFSISEKGRLKVLV